MHSMTGFGRGEAENERRRIRVSLRGVNHRFLDLVLRGGDELRDVEPLLRERLVRDLARGRVEVHVHVAAIGSAAGPEIDEALVQALGEVGERLVAAGHIGSAQLGLADLLRIPGVLQSESADLSWQDSDKTVLLEALEAALGQLMTARKTEGENLQRALEQRLDGLEALVVDLRARQERLTDELLTQLRARIADLMGEVAADPERILQEAALLVDKSDVGEELDRLAAHLEHFREVVGQEGSLGKRLDFLAQEIFRELNTIGSKCRNSEVTRQVVDGKVLCEQLREQVQNVE